MSKTQFTWSILLRIIAAAMLIWALDRHPYDYYTLLRWIVCGVSITMAYLSYVAKDEQTDGWFWSFVVVAVIFNPLVKVQLSRNSWRPIDLAASALMIVSIFFLQRRQNREIAE